MVSEKRYRAGAIGRTGKGNFGHGLHVCYKQVDRVDFVAVADEDPTGRRKAAEETGAKRTYSDYKEMLAVEDLDIVSVCPRWVDCHEEMVIACAEAGCHVYCEKPMAASLDSADRIVEAADRAGVKVAVAHQAVYLPQVQRIREMVEEGKIGRILSFHSSGKQDHRGGGEDLVVLGTHLFNLMRFFAGDVAWMFGHVTAEGKDIGACDVREAGEPIGPVAGDFVETTYSFKSGAKGHFVSRARGDSGGGHYGLEIAGEAGRIAFNADASMVTLVDDDAHTPWDSAQEREALSLGDSPLFDGNRLAVLDLIDAVENDRDPRSSATDARSALEMILGAYESQITGGRVTLPLENRRHPLERLRDGTQA